MKASELRELGEADLKQKLEELRTEHFNLRFQRATGGLDNPMRLSQVRKDIARVLTVLGEREAAKGPGGRRR